MASFFHLELIYPIILGQGKRLFGGTSHPIALKLAGSEATQSGILIARYERAELTSPSV